MAEREPDESEARAAVTTLRDSGAPREDRDQAWVVFVRWLHEAHYRPSLAARLRRRIERQGLLTHFAPCDVFSTYCLRVRENPALLGRRPLPGRTWIRRNLEAVCRELELRSRRREKGRHHLRSEVEQARLLDESEAPMTSTDVLASPEGAALLRDLEDELRRELARLLEESPDQARALALGAAGRPYRAIAERLGTTTGTVKSLVHRARAKLQKRLEEYLK
jgi:RNA polymerase sigma factor (sigma-70 family)